MNEATQKAETKPAPKKQESRARQDESTGDVRDLGLNLQDRGPERVSMTAKGKLAFPAGIDRDDNRFRYRWGKDNGEGSLQRYIDAWWELMKDSTGNYIRRPAGGGHNLYLLRIPIKYWKEDQEAAQAKNIDVVKESARLKQGEYVPKGQDAVISRDV